MRFALITWGIGDPMVPAGFPFLIVITGVTFEDSESFMAVFASLKTTLVIVKSETKR
jgi:hypothetical protein